MTKSTTRQAADVAHVVGRKNLIINGGMQVSQRGDFSAASSKVIGAYWIDRWKADYGLASTYSHTDADINTLPAKCKAMKAEASASATTYLGFRQLIENPAQYAGRTFTYSAWVRSNNTNARLTMYMIGSAQVVYSSTHTGGGNWEKLSVTFVVNSGVTSWYCDAFITSETIGGVPITAGDYIEVTGIQLELGSVATDFEHRSYGEELALCQRFYFRDSYINQMGFSYGVNGSSDGMAVKYTYPTTMRTAPTCTLTGGSDGGSYAAIYTQWPNVEGVHINLRSTNSAHNVWWAGAILTADAEL